MIALILRLTLFLVYASIQVWFFQVFKGKRGKPDVVAVHEVSLVIERNECFGMLGVRAICENPTNK